MKKIRLALLLGWLLFGFAFSTVFAIDLQHHPEIQNYIHGLSMKKGFDQATLKDLFQNVHFSETVIQKITTPYETKPWYLYRRHFLKPNRIKQGVAFWRRHELSLKQAEAYYGVPASLIVAIIGIESSYGKYQGRFRVIDALTTLAFQHPRRSKFFKNELTEFLLFAREEQTNSLSFYGSYAGAMGFGQFIPSSYRHYSVDFSGNGHRDLIHDPVDAIGSVANYLKENGWKPQEPIAASATLKAGKHHTFKESTLKAFQAQHTSTIEPLSEWKKQGVQVSGHFSKNLRGTLMTFEGRHHSEYWMGFHNFGVITRYNTSPLYALAVYQLSQQLSQEILHPTHFNLKHSVCEAKPHSTQHST